MKKVVLGVLAGLGALTLLLVVAFLGATVLAAVSKPGVPDGAVVQLHLGGSYIESMPSDLAAEFVLEDTGEFRSLVDVLVRAREDDRVVGLVAEVGGLGIGPAKAQELRQLILDFRESGKWAFAYMETAGEWRAANTTYWVASAFDSVFLAPPGDVNLVGINAATPFIRGTLEKLHIRPDMDHIGDYKTAMNSITEKSMTAEHREMMEWLVESLYSQMTREVAEARGMSVEDVEAIVDGAPYIAEEALEIGLVDELLYWDQVHARVVEKAGGERKLIKQGRYRDAAGGPWDEGEHQIAIIFGDGGVVRGESGVNPVTGGLVMGSDTVTEAFRDALDNPKIEAIVFRVDCPGGSYVASDLIYREVERANAEKPVVVSMSDVAGSGGYFVALPASRILAEPGTLTASIGVLSGKMDMRGFYNDKLGFTKDNVTRGRNATFFYDYQGYTSSERPRFQNMLDRIYSDFSHKVAAARDMEWEEVDALGRGRVWTGEQALERGLIDGLGGLEEAVEAARELAEIPEGESVRLRNFPKKKTKFELLMDFYTSGGDSPTLSLLREQLSVLQGHARALQAATGARGALSMPAIEF